MKRMFVQSGLALVGIIGQLLLPFQAKAAILCSATIGGVEYRWECPDSGHCDLIVDYDDDGQVSSISLTCV